MAALHKRNPKLNQKDFLSSALLGPKNTVAFVAGMAGSPVNILVAAWA